MKTKTNKSMVQARPAKEKCRCNRIGDEILIFSKIILRYFRFVGSLTIQGQPARTGSQSRYLLYVNLFRTLKGQCHEIFCFWFFSWISFPQASDYTIRTVSNFFENSRRYSQLKVCHRCQRHRWQMEKTFKQKNFNNFVWTPWGSRVNININFCLQVHFKVSAAWYCCHYLPPVSLIPAAICHRRRWHRWQICRRHRWHSRQICHLYQQR